MRVARAFGQDPQAVAARPFAETAWAHLQLLQVERFDEFIRDAEDLRSANRVSLAFNEPKALGEEHAALKRKWREGSADLSAETAHARGLALARRIAASGALLQ